MVSPLVIGRRRFKADGKIQSFCAVVYVYNFSACLDMLKPIDCAAEIIALYRVCQIKAGTGKISLLICQSRNAAYQHDSRNYHRNKFCVSFHSSTSIAFHD